MKIRKGVFEVVDRVEYLGITISSDGDRETNGIVATNKAIEANKTLLLCKIISSKSKRTETRIYNTINRR